MYVYGLRLRPVQRRTEPKPSHLDLTLGQEPIFKLIPKEVPIKLFLFFFCLQESKKGQEITILAIFADVDSTCVKTN